MGYSYTNITAATAAVTNQYVTSTNMKVGTYTVANSGLPPTSGARKVTVTHTGVTGTDTLGTITVAGLSIGGESISEAITPVADSLATGTLYFAKVLSITGAGWVINTGNDTLVVGCAAAAIVAVGTGVLRGVQINTTAASTIVVADAAGTIATLPASVAVGTFYEWDVNFSGFLSVTVNGASNITVMHTGSLPTTYAL